MRAKYQVTVSGSYRKHMESVRKAMADFRRAGAEILSPASGDVESIRQGFTHITGDASRDERVTEDRHLDAIDRSALLWLASPNGYIGASAAFELGYAYARDVPVFCPTRLTDVTLRHYVSSARGPSAALAQRRQAAPTRATLLLGPSEALPEMAKLFEKMEKIVRDANGSLPRDKAVRLKSLGREMRDLLGNLGR